MTPKAAVIDALPAGLFTTRDLCNRTGLPASRVSQVLRDLEAKPVVEVVGTSGRWFVYELPTSRARV